MEYIIARDSGDKFDYVIRSSWDAATWSLHSAVFNSLRDQGLLLSDLDAVVRKEAERIVTERRPRGIIVIDDETVIFQERERA
jgi:hypothetical protein